MLVKQTKRRKQSKRRTNLKINKNRGSVPSCEHGLALRRMTCHRRRGQNHAFAVTPFNCTSCKRSRRHRTSSLPILITLPPPHPIFQQATPLTFTSSLSHTNIQSRVTITNSRYNATRETRVTNPKMTNVCIIYRYKKSFGDSDTTV